LIASYRALVCDSGRLAFIVPGAVGRLPMAMRSLGAVLLIQGYTGSFGQAGTVGGVLTVVSAVASPRLGQLADRRSHRLVLYASLAAQALATVALILLAANEGSIVLLAVAAAVFGASAMPFPSISRAIWSARLERGPALERAFTVESVLDQVAFIIGPFLAILLSVEVHPTAGVIGALLMSIVATIGFARLPDIGAQRATSERHPPAIASRGLQVLVLAFVGLGVLYGAFEIGLVAFAEERGQPGAASVLVSLFAGGALVGAVAYGARTWRASAARRTIVAITWLALAMIPVAFSPGLWWSAAAILIAGFAISPGEIAAFTLVEQLVPSTARTEGFSWILAAISAGAALGVLLAGLAIDAEGARAGLLVAVGGGGLAVASLVLGAPALGRPYRATKLAGADTVGSIVDG
jgi:MFS family permease